MAEQSEVTGISAAGVTLDSVPPVSFCDGEEADEKGGVGRVLGCSVVGLFSASGSSVLLVSGGRAVVISPCSIVTFGPGVSPQSPSPEYLTKSRSTCALSSEGGQPGVDRGALRDRN
jgi:hypothetical protein